jgi:hypothetical protein
MADAATPKPSSSVKLVLLGEAAVGKSSLVMRFVNNEFQENKEPTIGGTFVYSSLHSQLAYAVSGGRLDSIALSAVSFLIRRCMY